MTSIYKTDEGKKQVISYYDNLLGQWYQPSKQLTIHTTFGDSFVIESGEDNRETVLFLHGSGSNSGMWTADVKELSENYHVYAIDIIGECGKSAENRPSFKNNSYSDWLFEIIDKLGLNKVSLVGCSLGGWIALDFAIKYPEKTAKLILMATAGVVQVKVKTIFWIIITSFLGSWGFKKLNKIVYNNLEIDEKALEFASLIKKHYKPRTDVLPVFQDESLKKIDIPTLFIGGENDCFYDSQKAASRLKENLKNVHCSVLEETGHVLINQTDKISQFLNSEYDV
jgi:pimeloyl-ACP methyl ester carboxylesterase